MSNVINKKNTSTGNTFHHVVYFEEIAREFPDLSIKGMLALLYVVDKPGISMREIESKLGQSSSANSRLIASLCETHRRGIAGANLIKLEEDPMDRRYKHVYPTTKGKMLFDRMAERLARITS